MVASWPLWSSGTSLTTTTITSSAISTLHARGFFSILAILAGTSPTVTISYSVGKTADGTFYAPIDGNATDLSVIYTSLADTKWITFSVGATAPYVKISAVDGADDDTTIEAYLFFQEEYTE